MFDFTLAVIIAAVAANGVLAGASLDQSIKQLPARHRMGVLAYSAYSRAGDLGNGKVWYASLGIGAALLAIVAAALILFQGSNTSNTTYAMPLYLAALLSILHSAVTAIAAPTNFSQLKHDGDQVALSAIFDRFARLQALRAFLQVLTFGSLLWALVAYLG